MHGTMNIKFKT